MDTLNPSLLPAFVLCLWSAGLPLVQVRGDRPGASVNEEAAGAIQSEWRVNAEVSRVYVKVAAEGLGHSHAVLGKLRSSSRVKLAVSLQSPDSAELLSATEDLDRYLSGLGDAATWRRYLQIAELKRLAAAERLEPSARGALNAIAATFGRVNRDPQYAGVAQEPSFQSSHIKLEHYVAPAGRLVFDMASFDADLPEARRHVSLSGELSSGDRQQINDSMRGPAVLDAQRFPDATYMITAVRPRDGQDAGAPGNYQLEGVFQLHGVSRSVEIAVRVEPGKTSEALRMQGQFSILQTQYGIKPYSALLGAARVADRLEIWGDLILVRPTAPAQQPDGRQPPTEQ